MKELRCPKCGHVFSVDQDVFDSIASQVRNAAFDEEVERRLAELRRQVTAELQADRLKSESALKERLGERERAVVERESGCA